MNKIPLYLGILTFFALLLAFASSLENINYWNLVFSKSDYYKTKFIPNSVVKVPVRANSKVMRVYLEGTIGNSEEELSFNYVDYNEKDIIALLQKSKPIIVWYNPNKSRVRVSGTSLRVIHGEFSFRNITKDVIIFSLKTLLPFIICVILCLFKIHSHKKLNKHYK